jgi:type IV pilus assembly protein PilM
MIKNVFLPEKIGAYYFFPQRIIGIDIGKTQITASQVYCKAKQRTIERIISEPLPSAGSYQERVSLALRSLFTRIDSYDVVYSTFPASLAFFKELTVPFIERERIALMYEYEVGPLLPFPLDNAVTDFIITKVDAAENRAHILVAAVQKQHMAELLAMFQAADIAPDKVTVDLFALYGLYRELPAGHEHTGNVALINLGFSTTRIAFIHQGQLKFIRVIPSGIGSLAKSLGTELSIAALDAHEQLLRFGLDHTDAHFRAALNKTFVEFIEPIRFTLESFAHKTNQGHIEQILLTGGGAEVTGMAPAFERHLHIDTALFPIEEIGAISQVIVSDKESLTQVAIMSLSVALSTSTIENSNLRTKEFTVSDNSLFLKQIGVSASLILLTLGLLIGNNFWQQRRLNTALTKAQKELVTTLTETQNLGVTASTPSEALDEARSKVEEQERIWFAFTARTRSSFLMYLQKLSTAIDKESLRLSLKKLMMTHETIRLEGEVKDIPALILLEEELQATGLGVFVSPQEPKFDITITLKKEGVTHDAT